MKGRAGLTIFEISSMYKYVYALISSASVSFCLCFITAIEKVIISNLNHSSSSLSVLVPFFFLTHILLLHSPSTFARPRKVKFGNSSLSDHTRQDFFIYFRNCLFLSIPLDFLCANLRFRIQAGNARK